MGDQIMWRRKGLYKYLLVTILLIGLNILLNNVYHLFEQNKTKSGHVTEGKTEIKSQTTSKVAPIQEVAKTPAPIQLEPISEVKSTKSLLTNVPLINQLPELPRGCEVTSLAMVLQSAGVSVDKMTLAQEINKVAFTDGNVYGNPNEGFVGDIYNMDDNGYGVYHGPLLKLEQKYLPNRAVDLTGKDISSIYNMIDDGVPVLVITNASFEPLDESEMETWPVDTGVVDVTPSEHCVVVVGYDSNYVFINNPLEDTPSMAVPRTAFEKAWVQMGSQALSYSGIEE